MSLHPPPNKKLMFAKVKKFVPILDWLPKYKAKFFRFDFFAGLTILALTIPENMAYAQLAGVPPEFGFFTSIAALISYAIFGSGKRTIVAVNSTIAIMSAIVVGTVIGEDPDKFIPMTIALAIVAGVIFLLAGIFRLGALSKFFSASVMTGFIIGLALIVIADQMYKLFGLQDTTGDFFARVFEVGKNVPQTNLWTLLIGTSSLIILFILGKYLRKIPAALVVLVLSILAVTIFNLDQKGVAIIGEIPAGLPHFQFPMISIREWIDLFPGAFGIVLVGYAETLSISRKFAAKHKEEVNPNQELIALGVANISSGFSSGFATDGSLSKTAANDMAGAKTPVSSLISAVLLIATILVLMPLFKNLPEAALAAIVIHAVSSLLRVKEFRRYWNVRKSEFWIAIISLLCILLFNIIIGLAISVGLSLILLIYRASTPHFTILGISSKTGQVEDINIHPQFKKIPGLEIIRIEGPLFFGNAAFIKSQIVSHFNKQKTHPHVLLIDLEASYNLDIASIDILAEIQNKMKKLGIDVWLTRVHGELPNIIKASEVLKVYKQKYIFNTMHSSITEFKKIYK